MTHKKNTIKDTIVWADSHGRKKACVEWRPGFPVGKGQFWRDMLGHTTLHRRGGYTQRYSQLCPSALYFFRRFADYQDETRQDSRLNVAVHQEIAEIEIFNM